MSEHELWNELGNLYYLSGAYDQAIHAYTRAITLDRKFGRPYSNLAQAYLQKERYSETIVLYKRGIVLLTDNREKALSWHKLGNVYRHLKDYSRAVEAYKMADELDPYFRDYVEIGNPADALLNRKSTPEELIGISDEISPIKFTEELLPSASSSTIELTAFVEELTPWDFDGQVEAPEDDMAFKDVELWSEEPGTTEQIETEEELISTEPLKWEVVTEVESTAESADVEVAEFDETELDVSPTVEEVFANMMSVVEQESSIDENIPAFEEPAISDEELENIELIETIQSGFEAMESGSLEDANNMEPDSIAEQVEVPEMIVENQPEFEVVESPSAVEVESVVASVAEEVAIPDLIEMTLPALELTDVQPVVETMTSEPEFIAEETTAADSVAYEHPSESSLFEIPQGELSKIVTEIDRMNRVLAINPQNAFAWDTIGGLFKSVGQYEDAIQAYQNAISIDPQKVFYFFHLGLMYAAAGRYEDAIDVFKHVLEMDPNHGLAHATLGGYYRRQGMDDLADAHLDRARELLADQENEYNRACMEAISGNSDRALELLELALKNKQTQAGWVVRDPDLDYVRSDPRFYALLNEYASRPVN